MLRVRCRQNSGMQQLSYLLRLAKPQWRLRRKRKRFTGKESTIKADVSHGSLKGLQKTVKSPTFPSSSLSLASVPDPALSDFALLCYTLVKDDALPIGYLQDFLSL